MAVRSEILNAEEEAVLNVEPDPLEPVVPAPVAAMPPRRQGENAAELKRAAVATFEDAKAYAAGSYSVMAEHSKRLTARLERRFHEAREEKPLLIVAVAAGVGLVLGIALRVWRSRNYE